MRRSPRLIEDPLPDGADLLTQATRDSIPAVAARYSARWHNTVVLE
jgi:hypothetical protein